MSRANIISPVKQQADDQADDGLDIPEFLKISGECRKQAWAEFDARRSTPTPTPDRKLTETERAYRASIERDRAAKRARDEVRFKVLREKSAAEKAERQAVKQAVQQQKREERRARHGA